MASSDWVPRGVDTDHPSAARVYDYFLGGAHNFAVDRELAAQIAAVTPNIGETMRAGRAFLHRSVRFLVNQGVRQYLDIGSGIPTAGNVHEIVQQSAPEATVVYVDLDPVAVAHSEAILAGNPQAVALHGDLREAEQILADARRTGLIDFNRPTAVLLAGVVHFLSDADDPAARVATLRAALSPGSYLVVSHATADHQPAEVIEGQRLSARTATEITLRTRAAIEGYFDGLHLVDPGLVFLPQWRPDTDEELPNPERVGAYGGVGRKD